MSTPHRNIDLGLKIVLGSTLFALFFSVLLGATIYLAFQVIPLGLVLHSKYGSPEKLWQPTAIIVAGLGVMALANWWDLSQEVLKSSTPVLLWVVTAIMISMVMWKRLREVK